MDFVVIHRKVNRNGLKINITYAWLFRIHICMLNSVWHRPLLVMWFFKNKCWIMITILAGIHACFQNTLKRNHKSVKLYFGVPEAKMTLIKTLYDDMAYLRTKMEGLNMNYNSGPHKHNHVLLFNQHHKKPSMSNRFKHGMHEWMLNSLTM